MSVGRGQTEQLNREREVQRQRLVWIGPGPCSPQRSEANTQVGGAPTRRRIPRPPLPRLPLSLRQRFCGQRSIFFICLMLLRLGMVTAEAIRTTHSPRQAIVGGLIFVLAVVIASPVRRLRATAVGLFTALFWSYALASPASLDAPTLGNWPLLLVIGFCAASVENVYSHATRRIETTERHRTAELARLRARAVEMQTISVMLVVFPVAFVLALDAGLYGVTSHSLTELIPLALSLPPVVGVGVYAMFAIRRVRSLKTGAAAVTAGA